MMSMRKVEHSRFSRQNELKEEFEGFVGCRKILTQWLIKH